MHLIFVSYDNDAERKKIEYLIAKYKAKRVKDVVIEVENSVFDSFIRELFGRLPEEKIRVFSATEKNASPERIKEDINESFNADIDTVKQFINYLIVRRRGNYRGKLGGFERYRLHTKKGLVDISLKYSESGTHTELRMILEGISEVVCKIKEEMKKEFENYKESLEPIRR